jgi:HPt (histidine-containing phosphotransfer) domain-containing protein
MEDLYSSKSLLQMMDGNTSEVRELALMLFELGPQMIVEIESAIANKQWEDAGNTSHKLKSTLKLWQMNNLVPLAFYIEDNGRKSLNKEGIVENFEILKVGFQKALDAMKLEFK